MSKSRTIEDGSESPVFDRYSTFTFSFFDFKPLTPNEKHISRLSTESTLEDDLDIPVELNKSLDQRKVFRRIVGERLVSFSRSNSVQDLNDLDEDRRIFQDYCQQGPKTQGNWFCSSECIIS